MEINRRAFQQARVRAGLSFRELAARAGVARDSVFYIEKGTQKPRPATIKKLADALGVSVDDLVVWTAEDEPTGEQR